MTPNRAEVQAAAERVRSVTKGDGTFWDRYSRIYENSKVSLVGDEAAIAEAYLAQDPSYADLTARLVAAEARLSEIDRHAKHDEADMAKMRDGTKLTRYGLVEIISYQWQDIRDLTAKLAAAEAQLAEEKREHLATQELHERSMRMIEEAIGPTRDLFDGWRAEASAKAIASIISQLAKALDQLAAFSDATPLTADVVMELLPAKWERGRAKYGDYGCIGWSVLQDTFTLAFCGAQVEMQKWNIGTFRHLLAALRIGGAA